MTRTRIVVSLAALLISLLANAGDINQDLIEAAQEGDTAAVQAMLAKGADVNAKDNTGQTALMFAAMVGDTATVEALLAAGADVNARNIGGATALIFAEAGGHTAVVELLKKAEAKK